LGIAQRQIQVKHTTNFGNQRRSNLLKINIRTAGDWLKVKRLEKNLSLGRAAAKMGIAASLVYAWENNTQQPENHQLKVLASVLDFDAKKFKNGCEHPQKLS
jgi:DNA-binding transcriptional regulator YiaG